MTQYAVPLEQRFRHALGDILRRIGALERRTSGIDSGMTLAILPAVIDPGYTSGLPAAFVNGAPALSGPYQFLSSYTPVASDTVLIAPVGGTAGIWVILGKY